MRRWYSRGLIALALSGLVWLGQDLTAQAPVAHAPVGVAIMADGRLLVAEALGQRLVQLDAAGAQVREAKLPAKATGLAVSPDGSTAAVTLGHSTVALFDADTLKAGKSYQVAGGPTAPVFSADGQRLFVASRWTDEVSAIGVGNGRQAWRTSVLRQPVSVARSADGQKLYVANLLSTDAAIAQTVAAEVSVLDAADGRLITNVRLPDGSHSLLGIAAAPDGQTVYVAHLLSRYHLPTTQLERGWMNTNALSVIDATADKLIDTVLLDEVDLGSANPWAVAVTPDSKTVCVTAAGTHELHLIDAVALRAKLDAAVQAAAAPPAGPYAAVTIGVSEDLTFMLGLRRRVPLPLNGPRCVAVTADRAVAAGYFSDTLALVDLKTDNAQQAKLLPEPTADTVRTGEMMFADGSMCFQHWQSCLSCHPDTRADGLNWDNLNDGIGNPKNTKSMYLTFQTPPAMSLGVRESVEAAVRAGVRSIQFATRPEEDLKKIDEYLRNLEAQPSPRLVNGKLSGAAKRGQRIFESRETGCIDCHSGEYFTTKDQYDVGTGTGREVDVPFDTPTLREVWRTAPYLHDGRATNLTELFTTFNPDEKHGRTKHLSAKELADLVEYIGSL